MFAAHGNLIRGTKQVGKKKLFAPKRDGERGGAVLLKGERMEEEG